MKALTVVLLAAATLVAGCTTVIVPPAGVVEPATVYVVDMGYHASLVVPGEGAGSLTEYAFGEWGWYAEGRRGWWRVPGIVFWPSPGALGRREMSDGTAGLAGLKVATGAEVVLPVVVERSKVVAWRAGMEAAWLRERGAHGVTRNPQHPLEFVPWDDRYWVFHTCNAAVAAWLGELGCEVRGWTVTSSFEVRGATATPGGAPPAPSGAGTPP